MLDLVIVRVIFVVVLSTCAYFLEPFGRGPALQSIAAAVGALLAGAIIFFELRLEQVSLKRLIGAAFGSILGIFGAFLMSLVLDKAGAGQADLGRFVQVGLLLWMTYVGLVVGAKKGDMLNLAALGGIFGGEKGPKKAFKILDTSVIIDGRIADIAETGFLDGVLVIPQFVLRELQLVADSADSLKRNRGRRGPRHPAAHPEDGASQRADRGRRFPPRPRRGHEADRAGQDLRLQDRHQRFQPQQGGAAARRARC